MLIWSKEIWLPPFGVILAVRKLVFIWGETEAMVPWTMVPVFSSIVTVSLVHFMRNLLRGLLSARPALVGPHVAFALQFSMRQALREGEGLGLPDELHFGGCLRSALSSSRQEDWYGEVRLQARRWVYCTNVARESSGWCQSASQSVIWRRTANTSQTLFFQCGSWLPGSVHSPLQSDCMQRVRSMKNLLENYAVAYV